jgi:hypothetical protein
VRLYRKQADYLCFQQCFWPKHCRICSDADCRWKKRYSRLVIADAAASALVRRAVDPAFGDPDRSLQQEGFCVANFFTGSFLAHKLWNACRIFGGDWLDWRCAAKDVPTNEPIDRGILLGVLWEFWHLPVIDFLGTATPYGRYSAPYFLAFVAAMSAMRVLIGWVYVNLQRAWR